MSLGRAADGRFTQLQIGAKQVFDREGRLSAHVRPHLFPCNTVSVPTFIGQQVAFHSSVSGLRVLLALVNERGGTMDFTELDPRDTFQFWINYYTVDGAVLTDGHSGAFAPGSITVNTSPSGETVDNHAAIAYDITATDLHANRPEAAAYYSIWIRPTDGVYGTSVNGPTIPVLRFAATPF